MVPLAHALEREGWLVSVARLAGHGTSPADLAQMTWKDWLRSAEDAYHALHDDCGRVAVIGLSMGGALGLYLAGRVHAAAVVAISTPIRVRPAMAMASRMTARVLPFAPVVVRLGPREVAMRRYRSPYRRIPLRSISEVDALLEAMREALPRVRAPALILQGRRDWVIPRESAGELRRGLAHGDVRVVWLPHSGHVATLDRDRERLSDVVREFLHAHLDRGVGGEAVGGGAAD
jgi:carboxylesterase